MSRPDAALRLLGLAARAGAVAPGTERVREAAREGRARLVIVAGDASPNALDKVVPLLERRGIPYRRAYDRARLGEAVGRGRSSAVGVLDPRLAARIEQLLAEEADHRPATGRDTRS